MIFVDGGGSDGHLVAIGVTFSRCWRAAVLIWRFPCPLSATGAGPLFLSWFLSLFMAEGVGGAFLAVFVPIDGSRGGGGVLVVIFVAIFGGRGVCGVLSAVFVPLVGIGGAFDVLIVIVVPSASLLPSYSARMATFPTRPYISAPAPAGAWT